MKLCCLAYKYKKIKFLASWGLWHLCREMNLSFWCFYFDVWNILCSAFVCWLNSKFECSYAKPTRFADSLGLDWIIIFVFLKIPSFVFLGNSSLWLPLHYANPRDATLCGNLSCRIPVPPINPSRGSDLFPGPGAGMYPRRYVSIPNYWLFVIAISFYL